MAGACSLVPPPVSGYVRLLCLRAWMLPLTRGSTCAPLQLAKRRTKVYKTKNISETRCVRWVCDGCAMGASVGRSLCNCRAPPTPMSHARHPCTRNVPVVVAASHGLRRTWARLALALSGECLCRYRAVSAFLPLTRACGAAWSVRVGPALRSPAHRSGGVVTSRTVPRSGTGRKSLTRRVSGDVAGPPALGVSTPIVHGDGSQHVCYCRRPVCYATVRRLGLRIALAAKYRERRVVVVDDVALEVRQRHAPVRHTPRILTNTPRACVCRAWPQSHKTGEFVSLLKAHGWDKARVLVVDGESGRALRCYPLPRAALIDARMAMACPQTPSSTPHSCRRLPTSSACCRCPCGYAARKHRTRCRPLLLTLALLTCARVGCVSTCGLQGLNVFSILKMDLLVITPRALEGVYERLIDGYEGNYDLYELPGDAEVVEGGEASQAAQ